MSETSGLLAFALRVVTAIPPLRRWLNRRLINSYAYAVPPRPRPLSMAAPYPSWEGLTNRRWSGRHLPPVPDQDLPDPEAVMALFQPTEDRRATDTALIFPMFAQWFTDSFLRTKINAEGPQDFRENESNHEIDLCQIYGLTAAQTAMLRSMEGGRLKSQTVNGEDWPPFLFEPGPDGRPRVKPEFDGLFTANNLARVHGGLSDAQKLACFATGLEHGDSVIGNSLMTAVWLREHNRVAGLVQAAHPDWDDERLFQTARNVCIVMLLRVVVGDYIVHIAPIPFPLSAEPGLADSERWNRSNWIAVEFALLYRWHDLIPDTVVMNGRERPAAEMLRANETAMEMGAAALALEAAGQRAGRIGLEDTPAFLLPVRRRSLEMARACQLAPFNAYRVRYGLAPIESFEALTGETRLAARLRDVYGAIDKLEWFVGLWAEGYGARDMMGETLVRMVANDAFTQALTNPLLGAEVYGAHTFSAVGLAEIEATASLAQIIARNTGAAPENLSFRLPPAA